MFEQIIGNEQAKHYLIRTAERGTVGNSLLFAGPEGIGKSLFAEAFAKLLLCQHDPEHIHKRKIEAGNHPDLHVYRPEGKIGMHTIASMRQFTEEVYTAPYEAMWKVLIIHNADRMLTYSANALLKTFEEPAKNSVIILLSDTPASLLPTVLSRCRMIHFHLIPEEEIASFLTRHKGMGREEALAIAAAAQGSIGRALKIAENGACPMRKLILDLLASGGMRDYQQLANAAQTISQHIESGKKEREAGIREGVLGGMENLSAVHKQSLEKEVEGVLSLHAAHEAQALFDIVLGWHRDMHLIRVNGNRNYLIHRDYASSCSQSFERGELVALEAVQKAVAEARVSLDRSTSLSICFENLFLKTLRR